MSKPRVIKSYNKLSTELKQKIGEKYPYGFEKHLISFVNFDGKKVKALPFSTDETDYLIKASIEEASGMSAFSDEPYQESFDVMNIEEIEVEEIKLDKTKEMAE